MRGSARPTLLALLCGLLVSGAAFATLLVVDERLLGIQSPARGQLTSGDDLVIPPTQVVVVGEPRGERPRQRPERRRAGRPRRSEPRGAIRVAPQRVSAPVVQRPASAPRPGGEREPARRPEPEPPQDDGPGVEDIAPTVAQVGAGVQKTLEDPAGALATVTRGVSKTTDCLVAFLAAQRCPHAPPTG